MSSQRNEAFEAGVLKSLVDFKFQSYATPRLIRIMYAISFGMIALYGLIFFVGGLSEGGLVAFAALVGVPLLVVLMLLYARVMTEILAVLFRLGENTSRMVALLERGAGPGGGSPHGAGGPWHGGAAPDTGRPGGADQQPPPSPTP